MFKNKSIERRFEFIGNQWFGKGNYFDSPLRGVQNQNDYPFKKYFIESDAPILEGVPKKGVINNVKVAIQLGNIYDLSRMQRQKKRALIVTKISGDRFKILNGNNVTVFERQELDRYKVPLYINTMIMKPLDLENPGPNTLSSKFFTQDGVGDQGKAYQMKFYLSLRKMLLFPESPSKQASEELLNYVNISSAEILSYAQLKQKGVYDSRDTFVPSSNYLKDRLIVDFFDLSLKFAYQPVGSLAGIEWVSEAVNFDLKDFSDNFGKKLKEDQVSSQSLIFRPVNWGNFDSDSIVDDLFIRI